jgi:hypothetical protein
MNAELLYSLIGNNLVYTGKAAKFSLHSAGVFYYTQNEFQSWQGFLSLAKRLSLSLALTPVGADLQVSPNEQP